MNIGIDIDDTISDTFETLLPYSQKYTIEDLKRKSNIKLKNNFKDHFYIEYANEWTEEEAKKFWDKYYIEIIKQVNIKKFASTVIKKLKEEGHRIYIITARWNTVGTETADVTNQWLKDNNVEYDELYINATDKLQLIKEKNIDIFIDDSFKNCKQVVDNSNTKVYMMNSRINEAFNDEKIQRVFSWPEIYDLINKEGN